MKLSLLDYGLRDEGRNAVEAMQDTLALTRLAEELGYDRFWLAEHHHVPALSISSPELVLAYLASQTTHLQLGTAGIMGLHYAPYKVGEWVATLETLFPGRLSIGLGNSVGTTLVSRHLQTLYQPGQFREWLEAFLAYLTDQVDTLSLSPALPRLPQLVTLGMGGQSLLHAAELGMGYVFGSFPYMVHDPLEQAQELAQRYRATFTPTAVGQAPYFALALFVVVAPTSQEAEELANAVAIWMLGKDDFTEFSQFPSPKTAQAYALTGAEKDAVAGFCQRMIVGNPTEVKEKIDCLIAVSQPDELILIPLLPQVSNRLQAIEIMARLYK